MQERISTPIIVKNKIPAALTSYDVLKSVALLTMIIDHLGLFLFSDHEIFRLIGRFSAPIWLFLIGYAQSTDVTPRLWGCAFVVLIAHIVAGAQMLPANILFSIIIIRSFRHDLVFRSFYSPESLRGMFLVLFFSVFFAEQVFEYIAVGSMFVLYGFMTRNPDVAQKNIAKKYLQYFVIGTFASYILFQVGSMQNISMTQLICVVIGFGVMGGVLSKFKLIVYKDAQRYLSRPVVFILQLFGRRSLEIYAAHIVVLLAASVYFYPAEYNPLSWDFLPTMVVELLEVNGIFL